MFAESAPGQGRPGLSLRAPALGRRGALCLVPIALVGVASALGVDTLGDSYRVALVPLLLTTAFAAYALRGVHLALALALNGFAAVAQAIVVAGALGREHVVISLLAILGTLVIVRIPTELAAAVSEDPETLDERGDHPT